MKSKEISRLFDQIADALEFQGENQFKVGAYRKVARTLSEMAEDIEVIHREGRLREIPGVGEGIAQHITEYLETGKISKYEEELKKVPAELIQLMDIPGMGPKTLALANKKLGVKNLSDLKKAIENGSLAGIPGLGEKKVGNIRKGIARFEKVKERIPLGMALPLAEEIMTGLRGKFKITMISPAGSLRRMRETVGDIDILAGSSQGKKIVEAFTRLPMVKETLAAGDTKGSIITDEGLQVDLRVVPEKAFGAALQYFTGSQAHNVKLRGIAHKMGIKVNEYGVFRGEKLIAGQTEEGVYQSLGMQCPPPEMREDRGEIELAREGKIPRLVEIPDIRGDLHVHSRHSDGSGEIEEIAGKAREKGYQWIAICDHSKSARYARGLPEAEVLKVIEEIEELNQRLKGIRVLAGAEVDILPDGSLDFPDRILKKLDVVVGAVHQGFKKNVTGRMTRAMDNPYLKIIAHPTGRLISAREGYEIDIEAVMEKAARTGTALEINAHYDRLDLDDLNAMKAKKAGVKIAIGTDAHSVRMLDYMRLGVAVARRGWLGPEDIVNTWSADKIINWQKKQ
ncbi:MAG: DNA polymerase/3'-5' exonuclease PolX [bacterium]|nr:DNA polymerase/3'-5' exonuclease PolX [bacterium]